MENKNLEPTLAQKLGAGVKAMREKRNMTQEILAEKTGLTINFISRVENGRKNFSPKTLANIAETLAYPPELLMALGTISLNCTTPFPIIFDRLKELLLEQLEV